jgi:hypothetical protein
VYPRSAKKVKYAQIMKRMAMELYTTIIICFQDSLMFLM